MRRMKWPALAMLVAGCGSSGPGSPAPGGAALAYSRPTTGPLHYQVGDTVIVSMDVAGNAVQVNVQSRAVLGIALERLAEGLAGTITFDSLSGEMTNTMGPGTSVSDADKPGPTGVAVDPRGVVTITTKPELSSALSQVLGSQDYAQQLFIRLPGRAVPPGTSWTDTLSTTQETAGMSTTRRAVVTSTLRGDTTVDGTSLLVIDSKTAVTQQMSGSNQGVELHQAFSGTTDAVSLWDPVRGVLVERAESGVMTGTMELPAMGMSGMPLNVRQSLVIRLRR